VGGLSGNSTSTPEITRRWRWHSGLVKRLVASNCLRRTSRRPGAVDVVARPFAPPPAVNRPRFEVGRTKAILHRALTGCTLPARRTVDEQASCGVHRPQHLPRLERSLCLTSSTLRAHHRYRTSMRPAGSVSSKKKMLCRSGGRLRSVQKKKLFPRPHATGECN